MLPSASCTAACGEEEYQMLSGSSLPLHCAVMCVHCSCVSICYVVFLEFRSPGLALQAKLTTMSSSSYQVVRFAGWPSSDYPHCCARHDGHAPVHVRCAAACQLLSSRCGDVSTADGGEFLGLPAGHTPWQPQTSPSSAVLAVPHLVA